MKQNEPSELLYMTEDMEWREQEEERLVPASIFIAVWETHMGSHRTDKTPHTSPA